MDFQYLPSKLEKSNLIANLIWTGVKIAVTLGGSYLAYNKFFKEEKKEEKPAGDGFDNV